MAAEAALTRARVRFKCKWGGLLFGATMSQGTSNDSVGNLRYNAKRSISLIEADLENAGIEGVRSKLA